MIWRGIKRTGSQHLACWFKNGLEGAVNMWRNYGTDSQRLACRFKNGLEVQVICWGMTGLDHIAWNVGLKIVCMGRLGRLGRLDLSDGPYGDRAVWSDWRLRVVSWNRSATIVSWGAAGGGKQWLAPIESVLQGWGVFVSENQNNKNRLHTNPNEHVVQDSIKNA